MGLGTSDRIGAFLKRPSERTIANLRELDTRTFLLLSRPGPTCFIVVEPPSQQQQEQQEPTQAELERQLELEQQRHEELAIARSLRELSFQDELTVDEMQHRLGGAFADAMHGDGDGAGVTGLSQARHAPLPPPPPPPPSVPPRPVKFKVTIGSTQSCSCGGGLAKTGIGAGSSSSRSAHCSAARHASESLHPASTEHSRPNRSSRSSNGSNGAGSENRDGNGSTSGSKPEEEDNSGPSVCVHLLFVLHRVLGVPRTNSLLWQVSLTERELDEALRCEHFKRKHRAGVGAGSSSSASTSGGTAGRNQPSSGKQRQRNKDDGSVSPRPLADSGPCPICYEEVSNCAPSMLVYCRYSCGNYVHGRCMKMWSKHQSESEKELSCPMCRQPWGSFTVCLIHQSHAISRRSCAVLLRNNRRFASRSPITHRRANDDAPMSSHARTHARSRHTHNAQRTTHNAQRSWLYP